MAKTTLPSPKQPFDFATSRVGGGPVSKMIMGGLLALGHLTLYFAASDLEDATNKLVGVCIGLGVFAWGYCQHRRGGQR